MFKKQALYQAKTDTLMAGIKFINAQAEAMHELQNKIEEDIVKYKKLNDWMRSFIQDPNTNEQDKSELSDRVYSHEKELETLQVNKETIKRFTEQLVAYKSKILGVNNSQLSESLSITNPFDNYEHINLEPFVQSKTPSFFSGKTYKQLKDAEATFNSTQLNEQNMISFRKNTACALIASLFVITMFGTLAAGLALAVCVNPILGLIMIGLTGALCIYFATRLERDMENLGTYFTKLDEQITLETPNIPLFSELDNLVACTEEDAKQEHTLSHMAMAAAL